MLEGHHLVASITYWLQKVFAFCAVCMSQLLLTGLFIEHYLAGRHSMT